MPVAVQSSSSSRTPATTTIRRSERVPTKNPRFSFGEAQKGTKTSKPPAAKTAKENGDLATASLCYSCKKPVEEQLAVDCGHCKNPFHKGCSVVSESDNGERNSVLECPWICASCLVNPTLSFFVTTVKNQNKIIQTFVERVSELEKTLKQLMPRKTPDWPLPGRSNMTQKEPQQEADTRGCTTPSQPGWQTIARKNPKTVQPIRKQDKRESQTDLTVICTNLPESSSPSFIERAKEDLSKWEATCSLLNIEAKPVSMTRLYRHPDSPHSGEPRLLRIRLNSSSDMENLLLSSHLLRTTSDVRIFPDIPWTERRTMRKNPDAQRVINDNKSLFIYGVPELKNTDESLNHRHDCNQWKFLQTLLGAEHMVTTKLFRIPQRLADTEKPRTMKVLLSSEDTVKEVLAAWPHVKRFAPPGLKLLPCLPRKSENQLTTTEKTVVTEDEPLTIPFKAPNDSINFTIELNIPSESKNGPIPAQTGSEHF